MMETLVQREKNPREVVSHHGLIKLLVEHALHKEGFTWNNIIRPPVILTESEVVALQVAQQETPTLLTLEGAMAATPPPGNSTMDTSEPNVQLLHQVTVPGYNEPTYCNSSTKEIQKDN
jgi:hypothetical protein